MKASRVIRFIKVVVVVGLASCGVFAFYTWPNNVMKNVMESSQYLMEVPNSDVKLLDPQIRIHDYRILSEKSQKVLEKKEVIDLKDTNSVQTFEAGKYIKREIYTEIVTSAKLSRRFYGIDNMSFGLGEMYFEISLSEDYKLLIGRDFNAVVREGHAIPYYKVENHQEIKDKLVQAINQYIEK